MPDNNTHLSQQLERLIALGEQELESAKAGDWEQVESQEKHRQQMLRQVLGGKLPAELGQQIAASIEKIKQTEQQILALTNDSRSEASAQLKKLQHGNKAIKSYQQAT